MNPKKISTGRLLLAVHTATPYQGVALLEEGSLLGESLWLAGESGPLCRPYTPILAAEVESLMKRMGSSWKQVAVIGLARGPGSFTGVRSGMAFAKGLGFALGIPLQAVGTLEALALQAGEGLVCPLLDARRSQLYWGLYRVGPTSIEPVAPPQVSSPDQVAEELAKWPEPITLLGEPLGWIPFPGCRQASRAAWVLRTASVGTLAWRTFLAGKGQPAGQVTPLYLRSPI